MAYQDIPAELRAIPAWVCWRYEDIGAAKPTKVPYDPKSDKHAAVDNPATWSSYDLVVSKAKEYSGIGFVFSNNDPYSFIDLDDTSGDQAALDRQIKIYREFCSYSEISPSGKGLHIIVRGVVPAGRRRSHIEIYSSQRYATMTGNVYNDKPIEDRQSILISLWEQMGAGAPATLLYTGDTKEQFNDDEIVKQAKSATNGIKFETLFTGKWQDLYQSQSEADYALIDIIAFYTQNKKQIERIFHKSALSRDKSRLRKSYLNQMILKSFDRMLPPLDFDGFKNALEAKQLELKLAAGSSSGKTADFESVNAVSITAPAANEVAKGSTIAIPPGLLGELAQFIYQAAPRPVPEIALAAAIGLMAGITGRAYNISGTGLNQYVLILAATGSGKEAAALGIDRLMNTIKLQVPTSANFIGPSQIASGQALVKYFAKISQCFVSILGEFGLRLERMSSHNASSSEKMLKEVLLDLYNKSGHGQVYHKSVFADAEKTINSTDSPALTILGESTPERFYSALNEDMISEGLLPRFMIMEYNGIRPPLSETHLQAIPSFNLTERLASLVANVEIVMHGKRVINVLSSSEASVALKSFDKFADNQINGTNKEVLRQLWNRAHIKVLKLSALVAVGINMSDPVIEASYVTWAIGLVQSDIRALSAKFEAGEIGVNTFETKQIAEMIRMFKEYVTEPWEKVNKYSKHRLMYDAKVIPYAYISRRLIATASFRLDKNGSTVAIKRALQNLIDGDKIREAAKPYLVKEFGTSQRCFIISDVDLIN